MWLHTNLHLRLNVILLPFLYPLPLILIGRIIRLVGRDLFRLLVFNLFRQDQVEEQTYERRDREAGLKHQFNGVEEPLQSVIVAGIGEDIGEPTI